MVVLFDGSKAGQRAKIPGLERAGDRRHGLNHTGHEGGLHLRDCVIDGDAPAFVENLHAEDLGSAHGAVFVGARERDIEGQHLVGIPGQSQFIFRIEVGDLGVELVDGGADRETGVTYDRRLEQSVGVRCVELVLGADRIDVGDEAALGVVEEVQQGMTIEVDPDEVAGDAALVTGIGRVFGSDRQGSRIGM